MPNVPETETITTDGAVTVTPTGTAGTLNDAIAYANAGNTETATFGNDITEGNLPTTVSYTGTGALTLDGAGYTLTGSAAGPALNIANGAVTIDSLFVEPGAGGVAFDFIPTGVSPSLTAAEIVFTGDSNSEVDGVIEGVGSIVVNTDAADVTLSVADTYTGKTIITGGTLFLAGAGSIADSHNVTLGATGVLDVTTITAATSINELTGVAGSSVLLGDSTLTVNENVVNAAFSGTFTGNADSHLVLDGPDSLTLSGDNSGTFLGHLNIGTDVIVSGTGSVAGAANVTLQATGVLDVSGVTGGAAAVNELTGQTGSSVVLGATTLSITENVMNASFSGVISGSGGITFNGPDTLILAGAETYTGTTEVDSGTLALGFNGSIADSSGVVVNGGTLSLASAESSTGGNVNESIASLTGTGGTVALGTNSLTITGTNAGTFDGVITGGQVSNAGSPNQGSVTIAAGADLALGGDDSSYTGKTIVDGSLTLTGEGGGLIALSHNVTLGAGGTLTIDIDPGDGTGINELTGVAGSSVYLESGTLQVNENVVNASFSGIISGDGNFELSGAHSLTLNGVETFTGEATVDSGGTLVLGAGASIALADEVNVNGTLDLSGAGATNTITELYGEGSVLLGSSTLVLTGDDGDFSGVISGTGNLQIGGGAGPAFSESYAELDGANTYTGKTVIYGELDLGGEGSDIASSHNVSLAGANAELYLYSSQTIHELTGVAGSTVNIGEDGSILTIIEDVTNATFSGSITDEASYYDDGAGSLEVAASTTGTTYTLTLNGASDYYGDTYIDAGATLALGANGTLGGTYVQYVDQTNDEGFEEEGASTTYVDGVLDISGASSGGPVVITNLSDGSNEEGPLISPNFSSPEADVATGSIILGANTLEDAIFGDEGYNTFGGVISGTGGLTVINEDGSYFNGLILTGDNTYTGTTTVESAYGSNEESSVVLAIEGTTMTSNIVVGAGGVLDLDVSGTFSAPVTGSGGLEIGYFGINPNVTVTTAFENFTGYVEVDNASTLTLGAGAAIAKAEYVDLYDDATLDLSSAGGTVTITELYTEEGTTVVLGANTLEFTGSGEDDSEINGVITGSGGLQIDAGADVELEGGTGSSYTGKTVIFGELDIYDGSSQLASSHNVSLRTGGELYIESDGTTTINELTGQVNSELYLDSALTVNENVTAASFSGLIEGSGAFTLEGADTLTLLGADTSTGVTTIDAGATLAIGAGGSIADSNAIVVSGTLDLSHAGSTASLIDLSGTGSVILGATALTVTENGTSAAAAADTFSGVISGTGSLTVDGSTTSGTHFVLSGANTFSGGLTIASGTVELVAANSAGTGTVTFHDASDAGVLQIDTLAGSGANQTFANTITGMAAVGVSGGDIIDLTSVTYQGVTATNYNSTTHVLTLTEGNATVALTITGVPSGDTFEAYQDSHGGTYLVLEAGTPTTQATYEASHYHP